MGEALGHVVTLVGGLVAALIVLGIILVVLKASRDNSVFRAVHDGGRFLVGPFDGMFRPHDARLGLAANWGIAAIVYVIAARVVARALLRLDRIG